MSILTVVGLMSGTSLDGIDAALVRTDGLTQIETGRHFTRPYDPEFRVRLRGILGGVGDVPPVEAELTRFHAAVVRDLLAEAGLAAGDVDLIGFHGHTISHAPEQKRTWQIGDGALLSELTGISVVNDFRSADVAAGGQGAPLVPLYHQALATQLERPLAVLNLGGVGNVTWLGEAPDAILAFDTGPGNALLDDWMLRHTGAPFDQNGATASAGKENEKVLADLTAHPYFSARPPKSLDRDAFAVARLAGLSLEDGAATLTAFTAQAVALAASMLPSPPKRWLVTGGGRHNATLMRALSAQLKAPVDSVDAVGWNGDALEAQAFAWLAVRSRLGLPLSVPGTTGIPAPMTGGRYHPAASQ